MRRFVEVVAGIGAVGATIAFYCWTIFGDWYSVEVCSPEGTCIREHQDALEHDPALLAFAAVSLVLGIVTGLVAVARSRIGPDIRPVMYGATFLFFAYNFVFLFSFGAIVAPVVPVLVVTCLAAAIAGHNARAQAVRAV